MRDGLSIATSALTSLLDNSKSKSATSALSKLKIKPEGTRDSKLSPTPSNQNSNQTDKVEQKSADAADIVRARISQTIPTLEIKLPLPWSLQAGEAGATVKTSYQIAMPVIASRIVDAMICFYMFITFLHCHDISCISCVIMTFIIESFAYHDLSGGRSEDPGSRWEH